jgi:hypothetical protein
MSITKQSIHPGVDIFIKQLQEILSLLHVLYLKAHDRVKALIKAFHTIITTE